MENLTELISREIKNQYRSVRRFAIHMGIPQTTLFSILKNGIGGTAYDTVVKICSELGIEVINYNSAVKIDNEVLGLIQKYNFLDELGSHTVNAVLNAEYERCKSGPAFMKITTIAEKLGADSENSDRSGFRVLKDE